MSVCLLTVLYCNSADPGGTEVIGIEVVTGKWFPGSDWENKVGICDWPALWTISFSAAHRKPQGALPGGRVTCPPFTLAHTFRNF